MDAKQWSHLPRLKKADLIELVIRIAQERDDLRQTRSELLDDVESAINLADAYKAELEKLSATVASVLKRKRRFLLSRSLN